MAINFKVIIVLLAKAKDLIEAENEVGVEVVLKVKVVTVEVALIEAVTFKVALIESTVTHVKVATLEVALVKLNVALQAKTQVQSACFERAPQCPFSQILTAELFFFF